MTYDAFAVFISPLAVHFGQVKDEPTWRLYHAALLAPPAPSVMLLERARIRAANRKFFPSTEELRSDAEAERQAVLAAHPYRPCEVCRDSSGFVSTIDDQGVSRMARCPCFERYRGELAQLGVGDQVLALPAAEEHV